MSKIEEIENKIREKLKEAHRWYDIDVINDETIEVEISDGDWKHDHLYVKNVVFEIAEPKRYEEIITEESEDDCYGAIHRFVF